MVELWRNKEDELNPIKLLKILGKYGHDYAHKSSSVDVIVCISKILDILSEDLYRQDTKP